MLRKVVRPIAMIAVCAFACVSGGFQAANTIGTIAVVVVDPSDKPLEGVTVDLATSGVTLSPGNSGTDTDKAVNPVVPSPRTFVQDAKSAGKITTDKEGKGQFKVKPGKYRVSTSNSDGNIIAYQTVKVEANKTINAKLRIPKR